MSSRKDVFGELTEDAALLEWCGEHDAALLTNNARDFEELHREIDHAGLLLYGSARRKPRPLARG